MKYILAIAALFAAVPAFGQSMTCRDLPKGNSYVFPNETVVDGGNGSRRACHIEDPAVSKPAAVPATPATPAMAATNHQKCLIVSIEKRSVLPHHGDAARIYRDSFNLDKKEYRSKYSDKDIQKLMRSGVHVVVLGADEQFDSREVCGQ